MSKAQSQDKCWSKKVISGHLGAGATTQRAKEIKSLWYICMIETFLKGFDFIFYSQDGNNYSISEGIFLHSMPYLYNLHKFLSNLNVRFLFLIDF